MVIIGAGLVGCETALYLAQQGKKVTAVELYDAMRDIYWINAMHLRELLDDAKVKILTYTNVLEITDEDVVIADEQGNRSTLEADSIVLAAGFEPTSLVIILSIRRRYPVDYESVTRTGATMLTLGFRVGERFGSLPRWHSIPGVTLCNHR